MIGCGKILCTLCNCYPCAYVQQGFAFGGVGLCTYVCKKISCLVPYHSKICYCVFDYLFTEFKCLVCYVQRAVQTEQFMYFQIKLGGSLGLGIFSSEL